jgi:hypothetical protein
LGDVEHGIALEKWDAARVLVLALRIIIILGREAVGIDDGGAVFALANIAA